MVDPKLRTRRHVLGWLAAAPAVASLLACDDAEGEMVVVEPIDARRPDAAADAQVADAGPDAAFPDASIPDAAPDAAPLAPDMALECDPTGSDAQGPFYARGAPERAVLAGPAERGDRLFIEGVVRGPRCAPLAGALLDVWQADANGDYHDAGAEWRLRGQMTTDAEGRYAFETIRPGNYPLAGSMRPAHIHFTVSHPRFSPVTTQLYFQGDRFLSPNDPCTANCDSGDPDRIVALVREDGALFGTFEIVLGAD